MRTNGFCNLLHGLALGLPLGQIHSVVDTVNKPPFFLLCAFLQLHIESVVSDPPSHPTPVRLPEYFQHTILVHTDMTRCSTCMYANIPLSTAVDRYHILLHIHVQGGWGNKAWDLETVSQLARRPLESSGKFSTVNSPASTARMQF